MQWVSSSGHVSPCPCNGERVRCQCHSLELHVAWRFGPPDQVLHLLADGICIDSQGKSFPKGNHASKLLPRLIIFQFPWHHPLQCPCIGGKFLCQHQNLEL